MNSEEIKEKLEDENIMAPKTSYRTKTPQKQKIIMPANTAHV